MSAWSVHCTLYIDWDYPPFDRDIFQRNLETLEFSKLSQNTN